MRELLTGVACLSSLVCLAVPAGAQELYFNGAPLDVRAGEVLLDPGVVNRLDIALPRDAGPGEAVRVKWELIAPLGQVQSGEGRIGAGSPRARFELGPLAAPPAYEFEAGQVFQTGYHLKVRLFDPGRTPVSRVVFLSGTRKVAVRGAAGDG